MKSSSLLIVAVLLAGLVFAPVDSRAADEQKAAKPYPLKTCIVSGEKLDSMGKPYVFTHEGREIKLCCKGCLVDFKKDSIKRVKMIEEAEKKQKK